MSYTFSLVKKKVERKEKGSNILYSMHPMPAIWANVPFLILWIIFYKLIEKITLDRLKRPMGGNTGKSHVSNTRVHGNPG
jgi:hypothetical protein